MEEKNTNFDFGKTKMSGDGNNPMFMKVVLREQLFRWIRRYIWVIIGVIGFSLSCYTGKTDQALTWFQSMISSI